jgi:hypothetical protein
MPFRALFQARTVINDQEEPETIYQQKGEPKSTKRSVFTQI